MRVDEYLSFVADMRKVKNKAKRIKEIVEITAIETVYMEED